MTTKRKFRIAAVGDLHCRMGRRDNFRRLVEAVIEQEAEALLLCGDLTDHGRPEEAELLAEVLSDVTVPKIGVLGNHDFDSGKAGEVTAILSEGGIEILDGDKYRIKGGAIGFAGVKGFAGGFDKHALQAFGEEPIKAFVMENVQEAMKLEGALTRLDTQLRVAITHYAPTASTCIGEPPQIAPFLGSSKLGEAIDAQDVAVAFHGHAHHGTVVGATAKGVPVYNVALPALRRIDPERRVLIVDLDLPVEVEGREPPPLQESPAVESPTTPAA